MTFPELIKILRQESFSLEAAWKIRREFNYYRFDSGAGKADGLEAAAGKYKDDLFARKFMRHRLSSGFFLFPAGEYREVYAKMMPAQRKQVIAAADLICRNRIPVFGEFADFGSEEINWQRDYKNDYCWDSQVLYYRKKSAGEVVKENRADVKIPWELSRLQFLSFLGIAYWLTDEKQYAREFSRLVNDWIDNNPPYRGINWACAMEVAIRAVNLIWGVAFFLDCPEISDELIYRIRKVLICSHRFIKGNLERKFRASGNHYLADLTGLIHLGIFLPDDCGDDLSWALDELYSEICRQVYLDGVSFEASTGYHRLALELFYSSALLCEVNKISFPDPFWEILSRMFGYARACRKPDLTACRFGDNDSGRLLSFALWIPRKRRYIAT
ncbi:MAG: heparinase II/III family protein, partial [bacterium]